MSNNNKFFIIMMAPPGSGKTKLKNKLIQEYELKEDNIFSQGIDDIVESCNSYKKNIKKSRTFRRFR